MAKSVAVTVGTTATKILGNETAAGTIGDHIYIRNNHATQDLYIGGSDVTTANGYRIAAGATFVLDDFDALWAVASGAGTDVRILIV